MKCAAFCIFTVVCYQSALRFRSTFKVIAGGYYVGSIDQERYATFCRIVQGLINVLIARSSIHQHARLINGRVLGESIVGYVLWWCLIFS